MREVQAQFAIAVDPSAAELQGGGNRERALELLLQRVEAKLDEKPGVATIYQASLAMFAGMFAVMIGTVLLLKSVNIIP